MYISYKIRNTRAKNFCKFWPLWLVFINDAITQIAAREKVYPGKHEFQYFTNIRTATLNPGNQSGNEVCLSTQSTIHRVQTIGDVANFWQGPISLAVFVYDKQEIQFLLKFLNYMEQCNHWFKQTVSVHLAAPKSLKINVTHLRLNLENISSRTSPAEICKEAPTFDSKHRNCARNFYPQNHMRNFAKWNCNTFWTISTDVDIIPSQGSADLLRTFLSTEASQSCLKCAFVIPVFETKLPLKDFPKNKIELGQLVRKKLVRQYHPFRSAVAGLTDHKRWFKASPTDQVEISHDVKINFRQVHDKNYTTWKPLYEPFYVVPKGIPDFDKRFLGFGQTRNSQVLESAIAGFNFKVLTPLYLIHLGASLGSKGVWCLRQRNFECGINTRIHAPKFIRDICKKYSSLEHQHEFCASPARRFTAGRQSLLSKNGSAVTSQIENWKKKSHR